MGMDSVARLRQGHIPLSMDYTSLRTDLEKVLQQSPLEPGEDLSAVLSRLDARRDEAELPDRLRHYLERRSYIKARHWIDNPGAPHQQ